MKKRKQLLFIILLGLVFIGSNAYLAISRYTPEKVKNMISSDALGYYNYSPYLFIKDDMLHQGYAMPLENGNTLNKYTCGVSILQLPFFLVAMEISPGFDYDETDANNAVYMTFMAIAVATYLYIALCILFFYIKNKFDQKTAWYSTLVLYFATNVYYYCVMEPGMSHIYSLFCFTMILYFTDKYYKNNKLSSVIGFGAFYALSVLIRPTNIVMVLFFLFYETYSLNDFKLRILQHIKRYYIFILLLIIGLIIASPQMLYWYAVTGKPVVFSYGYNHESFSNWKSPKIIEVLIGHRSGWLSFTPIMILSLIGLYMGIKEKKISATAISIVFVITLVTCASWWAYNFSCSFGYRSFVEYYAILLLPLALVSFKILNGKSKWMTWAFLLLSCICCFVNFRMTDLYLIGEDCWSHWMWNDYFDMLKKIF